MTTYIALLRAVNVGGTTPLPMNTLKAVCEAQGFTNVRTYIASGNVVFRSAKSEAAVKAALEAALKAETGKAIRVALRSAEPRIAGAVLGRALYDGRLTPAEALARAA